MKDVPPRNVLQKTKVGYGCQTRHLPRARSEQHRENFKLQWSYFLNHFISLTRALLFSMTFKCKTFIQKVVRFAYSCYFPPLLHLFELALHAFVPFSPLFDTVLYVTKRNLQIKTGYTCWVQYCVVEPRFPVRQQSWLYACMLAITWETPAHLYIIKELIPL